MKNISTKVSFKRCSAMDKKKFSQSKCIMPISIGVKVHEDEKFFITMQLINSSFKSCVLLIDDSIQKYTLKIVESHVELEKLHNKAVVAGDDWLKRNKYAYENLTIPCDIMRWDDWLSHKNFKESHARIEELYDNDNEYKNAIHANIKDYLDRYVKRMTHIDFDMEHAFHWCLRYLKEECAVMCLWAHEGFDFEVYPSGRNGSMKATYERMVLPMYPNLLKSISLYFERRIKKP